MEVDVRVHPTSSTNEFADTYLRLDGGRLLARLDVEYGPILDQCGAVPALATDFLTIAATVYAMDKLSSREQAVDRWTREFEVTLPVSDPSAWTTAAGLLGDGLSFLTGDYWGFEFTQLRTSSVRRSVRRSRKRASSSVAAVCLFSGGLDSLIGVINWLESNGSRVLLVGHHDGDVPGPFSDQRQLLTPLRAAYPNRTDALLARVGVSVAAEEITYRSRSIIFLALAMQAAASSGAHVPLLIPENGNIALNAPLTPARVGSCSTRTAHPYFLRCIELALTSVGLTNPIENPLRNATKGECVDGCSNKGLLRATYLLSASCAKRGHRASWVRRGARQCGRCMPCIYRRAALHAVGWDDETYGADFCAGEVDLDDVSTGADDFRAMLSFLRMQLSDAEIARRLLANGHFPSGQLTTAAAIVQRAANEVRALLQDKAKRSVLGRAGLSAPKGRSTG